MAIIALKRIDLKEARVFKNLFIYLDGDFKNMVICDIGLSVLINRLL